MPRVVRKGIAEGEVRAALGDAEARCGARASRLGGRRPATRAGVNRSRSRVRQAGRRRGAGIRRAAGRLGRRAIRVRDDCDRLGDLDLGAQADRASGA